MNESEKIPIPSLRRLSAYLRQLEVLSASEVTHVSSRQLANYSKVGDATIRRDLTLFGKFGQRGVGYEVDDLISTLRVILGTQRRWGVVLVGAGALGRALMRYSGFDQRGFKIIAAFDNDPKKIGTNLGDIPIHSLDELESVIDFTAARIAILTTPSQHAQEMATRLTAAGIEGILDFATPSLEVPPESYVTYVDITAHLEELTFQVSGNHP
ncbi:MAG: redox-sensing transcriptional repressor Rex [Phycisphaerae bacterium]|nr:redox-sensing transcriptional repressor Rex [Phycisphaerae bacterium]